MASREAQQMSAFRRDAEAIARELRKTVEVLKYADALIGRMNVEELIAEVLRFIRTADSGALR